MSGQYVVIYQQYIDQSFDLTIDMQKEKADETKGKAQGLNYFYLCIFYDFTFWISLAFVHL